ncbi:MAG: hypothetical protein KGH64_00615 [Candidatus Micrarchaeota archaeon]|nr:hypothetical protein [Candidatus Micrarchaeota archaeon]
MKAVTLYVCEICGYESSNQDDVRRCEATGLPEEDIVPGFEFNKEVPLYGRNGVKIAKVLNAYIVNTMGLPGCHRWIIKLDRFTMLGDSDWGFNGYEQEAHAHYLNPNNLDFVKC